MFNYQQELAVFRRINNWNEKDHISNTVNVIFTFLIDVS